MDYYCYRYCIVRITAFLAANGLVVASGVWSTLEIALAKTSFFVVSLAVTDISRWAFSPSDLDFNVTLFIWMRHVTAGLLRSRPLCRHLLNSTSGHDQLRALFVCCSLPNSASKHIPKSGLRISVLYLCRLLTIITQPVTMPLKTCIIDACISGRLLRP